MHIRHAGQVEDLTPADYIRWRSGVLTEIALELAQISTVEELQWAIESGETMSIIRAGYHDAAYNHFADKAGESSKDRVFLNMADALKQNFHTVEMVRMDGFYDEIFEKAIEYSRAFPYKTER
jgi:hypothetical protein